MKIVCISDTHMHEPSLPEGNMLIHCGDATMGGTSLEFVKFTNWWNNLDYQWKIFVPGNHDWLFEKDYQYTNDFFKHTFILIQDYIELDGLRIWGSPYQPFFCNWAFNLPRGKPLREKWEQIPENLDILITHSPPLGIGDLVSEGLKVGCSDLLHFVTLKKPKYHLFGHIHSGYGEYKKEHTTFYNCSLVNENYKLANKPWILDL